jgi:hypothetical protein
MNRLLAAMACSLLVAACSDSTGGNLVTFSAAAAGPANVAPGQAFEFVNDRGWHIVLDRAVLHVGAVYLNQSTPVSGAQNTSCILPGTYVAQVTKGTDVNLLSSEPQSFPERGTGVTIPALAGQVWLTGGPINTLADTTPILQVAGSADQNGVALSFAGTITIGSNRVAADSNGLAGASPICKQRIVSPIPTSVVPMTDGSLLLRIDPGEPLFTNVEFAAIDPLAGPYAFRDDSSDQPSLNLYNNLRSSGPYRFEWMR